MARVALTYNLIKASMLRNGPLDRFAEYDSEETIAALTAAIRAGGHEAIPLEADESVAEKLRSTQPEVVFNIAEGIRGESRESHVPAICEMLGLPYTGSGPLTLALCLNKARTKEILTYYGISTPPFQIFRSPDDDLNASLQFPLIVKLLHEGSSMGLSEQSVVDDENALRCRVAYLIQTYGEPAIVETFIDGREFTVGVLGDSEPWVLPIIEVRFNKPRGIVLFEPDEPLIPLILQARGATPALKRALHAANHHPICPADVDDDLARRIVKTALRAFRALGCRDWCRMEMRLGSDDALYVLELNPIAGIDPTYWLPQAARIAGLGYDAFVNAILDCALERAGLKQAA